MDSSNAYEALIEFLYRSPIGLVQIDADGTVDMMNPMAAQLLMPISGDGGLDNLYDSLNCVAPQLRALVEGAAGAGVVCDSLRMPVGNCGPAGTAGAPGMPQVLSISLLKVDAQRSMAVLTDATLESQREQRTLDSRLNAAARTDSLTRLANRVGVLEQLQRTIEGHAGTEGGEFAVLLINCDRFAHVNDTLGHAGGDEVLGLIADRLRATLRPGDAIARGGLASNSLMTARIGGDEFVVILDRLRRPDDVLVVTRRLLDVLSEPYRLRGGVVHATASIGVVLQPQAHGDAAAVLRDAGLAMRDAKQAGGARCVVFETGMRRRAEQRGGIEEDLRHAIPAGQLFVVYQPVVALRLDSDVSPPGQGPAGVEALVRWRHPQRGIVPPFEFIGIAEECGLICDIGEQVLVLACRQFAEWRVRLGERAPGSLAVNLSRAQLAHPDFVGLVARTLEATGIEPARLQLEVTESLAAQDSLVQARLHELKALGVTLALDDFGTGYSSLSSLHLLPVDTVKVDRSFVSAAATNAHQRVLIEATVRVAASLGMDTVAEGIETADQADVVRRLGCDKGQGYLYSRPLEADDLLSWLGRWGGA